MYCTFHLMNSFHSMCLYRLFYIISVSKHCKLSMRALEFDDCIMYDSVLISINIYVVYNLFFVCIAVHESAHQQMTFWQDINFSHLERTNVSSNGDARHLWRHFIAIGVTLL